MKKICKLLFIGILSIFVSCDEKNKKENFKESDDVINLTLTKNISKLIDSLYMVDQKVQLQLSELIKNGKHGQVGKLLAEEKDIFKRHIPILKEIYVEVGYPTVTLVGKESSSHFFTMVQHSDADLKFQEEMLTVVTEEVKNGNVNGKDFAYLTDRVQLANQKPQIFGTQLEYNTNIGQAYPKKLMDSVNVNKRRKEIGLATLQEYLNKASKMHFKMSKAHYDKIGLKEPKLYKTE